jgi:hypothetical protein
VIDREIPSEKSSTWPVVYHFETTPWDSLARIIDSCTVFRIPARQNTVRSWLRRYTESHSDWTNAMAESSWDQLTPRDKLDWLKIRQDRFDADLDRAFAGLRILQDRLRRLAVIMDRQSASMSKLGALLGELSQEALARQFGGTPEDRPAPQQPKVPATTRQAEKESEKGPGQSSGKSAPRPSGKRAPRKRPSR